MSSWLDRLVPADRCPDAEALRRARLTVLLASVLVVTAVVYAAFYGLVVGFREGAIAAAAGGGLAGTALAVTRRASTHRILGHVLAAILYGTLVAIIAYSGGLPSPVAPWLVLPPMFAALLLGRRSAAAWTGLGVLTVGAFLAAARVGVRFPVGYPAAWAPVVTAMSYAGLVVCSAVLVFVFEDIRERTQARAEAARAALARLAYHDALTGLTNRVRFLECLHEALARAAAEGDRGRVAVLLIDLDGFKTVNDTLGHAAGDALLTKVAARLLNATRGCDTVARLGGDEFAVLLANVRSDADTATVADRISDALAVPFSLAAGEASVGASIGVARVRAGTPAEENVAALLLHDADVAMYRAKSLGKGRWVRYEVGMRTTPTQAHAPAIDLPRAVARGTRGVA